MVGWGGSWRAEVGWVMQGWVRWSYKDGIGWVMKNIKILKILNYWCYNVSNPAIKIRSAGY